MERRHRVADSPVSFQIMVVAELYLNHQLYEPAATTSVLSTYQLSQFIEFPIRVCDLTPNTHVALTFYDMSRYEE